MRHAPRLAAASAAASALAFLVLLLVPAAPIDAHSELVSSVPGAGETLATAPSEARLVFTEPVDPAYTSLDVLDSQGHVLAEDIGAPDPEDARQFVAPLPAMGSGAYTISWRAVSAADGHSTTGFITFAVGDASLPEGALTGNGGSVDPHAGHGGLALVIEAIGRGVGALGFMVALGMALFAWLLRASGVQPSARFAQLAVAGLLAGGIGAVMLASTAPTTGLVTAANANLLAYLLTARSGQLLLVRIGLAALGTVITAGLLWRGRPVLLVASLFGAAGLVLTVLSSHAAAFTTPVPMLAEVIHLGAASAWAGGLLGFGVVLLGPRPLPDLRPLVPRFSAIALVSVTLIAATGAYEDWAETADPLSLGSDYQLVLGIKIALFLCALGFGAVNYLRGASVLDGRLGFRRRIFAEAGLAIAVVLVSGVLSSGTPLGGLRPISVAPAATSSGSVLTASLALAPARGGPNEFVVTGANVPDGDALVLVLERLDQSIGNARIPLQPKPDGSYTATGITLLAGSRWDATVALDAADQTERARARFVFGVGPEGLTEGEAAPLIPPEVLLGGLLVLAAVLGLSFGLAGGTLPRTEARTSRLALLSGGSLAAVLGAALLLAGTLR
jgi:copper transport protein